MSRTLPRLLEAAPAEAVEIARSALEAGQGDTWPQVDEALAHHLLRHLLEGVGDPLALGLALVDATDLARKYGASVWVARWSGYADLVEKARERPSSARILGLVLPRGAEVDVLRVLGEAGVPRRAGELAARLGLHDSAISRLLKNLQESGLIFRQRAGRAVWVMLTGQGREVATLLGQPLTKAEAPTTAPSASAKLRLPFWNTAAMTSVEIH